MILLKANLQLKTVFLQMIKSMGENVKWTEIFVINNNDIILAGKGRALFFNFDNRKSSSNVVELPIKEDRIEQITQNALLENALNMILYAFGKWGVIKGLKVDTNYDQLNKLINNILAEIGIEAVLTKDNFRFYKNGVQVTYEEVIKLILDLSKPEDKEDSEKETDENDYEDKKNGIGLWHNMVWTAGRFSFEKEEIAEIDRLKSRLGNDFYMVNYKCPVCREKLYMVVYPVGKEVRIETGREAVYMSRAYTCSTCNSFYTPKPHILLMEGDVYNLTFEEDREAYEDYIELLGRQGERTSNCNFNVFESEYNRKRPEVPAQLKEICMDMDSMSEEEISELKDKMDSGFYPEKSVEKYNKKVDRELKSRKYKKSKDKEKEIKEKEKEIKEKETKEKEDKERDTKERDTKERDTKEKETKEKGLSTSLLANISKKKHESAAAEKTVTQQEQKSNAGESKKESSLKTEQRRQDESESLQKETQKQDGTKFNLPESVFEPKAFETLKEILAALLKGEHDFFVGAVEKLSLKHLGELKLLIQSEQGIAENDKKNYIDEIDKTRYIEKEKELIQKAVSSKAKNYTEIQRVIDEIKKEDCVDSLKKTILNSLMELLKNRGKKELENILSHIPENISRKQYDQFKEKIEQYKDVDTSPYKKDLEEKRDAVEKQEIAAFIKRVNSTDRESLLDGYNRLKEQDFEERNVNSFLEKIHDKIYNLDEAAIKRICPDPADITFEEGLQAYEEISSGSFLPELKLNVLETIDKRLMKMKMDECEQLVKKLSKDMNLSPEDYSRIHFYEVRKMMKGDNKDAGSRLITNALNTYAVNRGKYEYPILICDASLFANGEEGFVLTQDHIFYNGLISAGKIDVIDIENVSAGSRLFRKGIYVNKKNTGKVKISNSLKSNKLKQFAMVLDDFVSYLKEKPESRNVSYMAKEKHTLKCCYRCGYSYKEGNICPKCGKYNE